ncbi:LysR family transcriptional regulator, partial [Mesorhizobium sp. M7A.F.Ca.CA.001.13.2.1]
VYFEVNPKPRHPRDLADHRCIRFRFSSGILYRWEFEKGREAIEMAVEGPLILDEDHLIAQAAIDGAGLAFVFEDYVRAPLADGRLIRVLEDWCPSFDGFFVYYPSRRQMRPALRAFVDFFKVSG